MISFLNGTIAEIRDDSCVIDVGGVGIEVMVTGPCTQELARTGIGGQAKLYTYLYLREEMICLYGFTSRDDLALFKKLITVSGIGPKGGLSLLSAIGSDDLIFAILTGDSKTIAKAPGIGKKTAERLCIDLRDKLEIKSAEDFSKEAAEASAEVPGVSSAESEAIEALEALGYARSEAARAVRKAKAGAGDDADTEKLLREALRYM